MVALGLHGLLNRAVYIVDSDGRVTDVWETADPTNELDYEELVAAVETAQ